MLKVVHKDESIDKVLKLDEVAKLAKVLREKWERQDREAAEMEEKNPVHQHQA